MVNSEYDYVVIDVNYIFGGEHTVEYIEAEI